MGILKIKNLIHDYIDEEEDSKFMAIDNVSFDVEAGQFITILGQTVQVNHHWQNTLMRCLCQQKVQYGLTA